MAGQLGGAAGARKAIGGRGGFGAGGSDEDGTKLRLRTVSVFISLVFFACCLFFCFFGAGCGRCSQVLIVFSRFGQVLGL